MAFNPQSDQLAMRRITPLTNALAMASALALGAFLPGASFGAATNPGPNPYARIAASNVFRLVPPSLPDTPVPVQQVRPPLPRIFITGLIEFRGEPRALVEIADPGQPVRRPILAEGGTCGVLEILQIDVRGEKVRARIDGTEEILKIQEPRPSAALPPTPTPREALLITTYRR